MIEDNNQEKMNSDLQKTIEQNIKLTKEVLKLTKKNNKMLNWQRAWGTLRVLLVIIPIILGFIYLPPLLNKFVNFYQNLLGLNEGVEKISPSKIDFNNIAPDILKKLNIKQDKNKNK